MNAIGWLSCDKNQSIKDCIKNQSNQSYSPIFNCIDGKECFKIISYNPNSNECTGTIVSQSTPSTTSLPQTITISIPSTPPILNTFQTTQPISSTFQTTPPILNTFQTTQPIQSTFQTTTPISSTFQTTTPISNTFQTTTPIPSTFQTTTIIVISLICILIFSLILLKNFRIYPLK